MSYPPTILAGRALLVLLLLNGALSFSLQTPLPRRIFENGGRSLSSFSGRECRRPSASAAARLGLVPCLANECHGPSTTSAELEDHNIVRTKWNVWDYSVVNRLRLNFLRRLLRFVVGGTTLAKVRRAVATIGLALAIVLGCFVPSKCATAVTGGRMGGSFGGSSSSGGCSTRSYSTRSYYSSHRPSYYSPRGSSYWCRPNRGYWYGPSSPYSGYSTRSRSTMPMPSTATSSSSSTTVEVVHKVDPFAVLVGSGVVIYAISRTTRGGDANTMVGGPLGSGVSLATLTVAMDVADRDDPTSILSKLKQLSETAGTDTRRGVQDLVANVALELLRQRDSVVSACSTYQHVSNADQAEREFNHLSVLERSKFDRETIMKFSGVANTAQHYISNTTSAIISIIIAIEGDMKVPTIRSRFHLNRALSRIAADVQVGECLQSAEVLWVPEDRSDTLSRKQIVSTYPDLVLV